MTALTDRLRAAAAEVTAAAGHEPYHAAVAATLEAAAVEGERIRGALYLMTDSAFDAWARGALPLVAQADALAGTVLDPVPPGRVPPPPWAC